MDDKVMKKLSVYHMDPTNPQPYKMDREKYDRLIAENLKMNEDLKYTPEQERYHFRLRTANEDLSIVNEFPRIKDWDAMVSPTKYKGYKNNLPGYNGAPYDYVKYLPPAE